MPETYPLASLTLRSNAVFVYSVYSVVHTVAASEVAELLLEAFAGLVGHVNSVLNIFILKSFTPKITASKRCRTTLSKATWSRYPERAKQCALSLSTGLCEVTVLMSLTALLWCSLQQSLPPSLPPSLPKVRPHVVSVLWLLACCTSGERVDEQY